MPHRFTSKTDGDAGGQLRTQRWAVLRQVHGSDVVVVDRPGHHGEGDALVTTTRGLRLSIRTADCAPVALLSDSVVGVVHAGWRGLLAGVIPATLEVMRDLGATDIEAHLGPCIHAECYEFDGPELDHLVDRFGPSVRGTTSWGTPALDVPAAVRAQLPGVIDVDVCTACSPDHWSFRKDGAAERQAVVAWLE